MLSPFIERYLRVNGIPFRLLSPEEAEVHPPRSEDDLVVKRVKSVLVEADGDEVICAIPENAEVDLDALADLLQAEETVLCEEGRELDLFPGCDFGAAPPFAGLWSLPLIVDSEIEFSDRLVMPAGRFDAYIEMRTTDLLYLEEPTVADVSVFPGEPWKHAMPVRWHPPEERPTVRR
jgi:Ala-tRNA(Pro) deacylase